VSLLANDRLTRTSVFALTAVLIALTWGIAGVGKLASGGVPDWFTEQFGKTFLASFPGLSASFYSIAILETIAALAAVGSLVTGEPFRRRSPSLLYAALLLSLLTFVQLNFGKQLLADFDGVHDLFMYFAGTLVMLAVVRSFDTPGAAALSAERR
jgi:hypothetical protein